MYVSVLLSWGLKQYSKNDLVVVVVSENKLIYIEGGELIGEPAKENEHVLDGEASAQKCSVK